MRKLVMGVLVLALLLAACGREGRPAAGDLGECEWVRDVRLPQADPGTAVNITQEDIDRVVSRVPDGAKGPIREIFGAAKELQERTREISDLPPEEQASVAAEIVQEYQASVPPAIQAFQEYVAEHCPSLSTPSD